MPSARISIKEQVNGKWFHILSCLGIDQDYLQDKHGPCPLCGGKDRFRWDDKQGRGTYYCQCGPGDGFQMLMKLHKWSFPETVNQIEELLKSTSQKITIPKDSQKKNPMEAINKIIAGTKPVNPYDPVSEYLVNRGISQMPATLGFHSGLFEPQSGKSYQTMIAKVIGPDGEIVSIHKTFLKDGHKANIESPRKISPPNGTINGAAIRLFPIHDEGILGIAEGIETAIAANEIFNLPVWSVMTANGIKTFKPPADIKTVVIFADNDKNFSGQMMAYSLANRLIGEGFKVEINIPCSQGSDWLDELIKKKRLNS